MSFGEDMNLTSIEQALQRAFPDLGAVSPLQLIGWGFSSWVVETASGVVFRIARSAEAGERYAREMQTLPCLKSFLPVAIPQPEWYLPASEDFSYGLIGYAKLSGTPLEIDSVTSLRRERELAEQMAHILLALHRIPLEILPFKDDPEGNCCQWKAQYAYVEPALRAALEPDEYLRVTGWWEAFLEDSAMRRYTPVFQHGDFWSGNLLEENGRITGLLDFENMGVGDPAVDFTPLLYLGERFFRQVLRFYQESDGADDAGFEHRLRQWWALREFSGLEWSVRRNDREELEDSIAKIRRGPILHPAGLDGWHRDI